VAEIRQMPKLRILKANDNNLTGIPAEIGQLTKLETIDFSNNQLDSMPMEIKNIRNNLKTFNLSGNRYTAQQINDLKAILPDTQIIY
jgi:Leucine-rich repeat (LRR) protein